MAKSELQSYYEDVGITSAHLSNCKLPLQTQAPLAELEVVDVDVEGRPFILMPVAAVAWRKLCVAARAEGIVVNPVSGFRSYLYQKKLIEKHLASGRSIDEILKGTAIPGYSEHHTGRAIDLCAEKHILEENFHLTETYRWLMEEAGQFNFRLSYPRDNEFGIIFEPWHWFYIG